MKGSYFHAVGNARKFAKGLARDAGLRVGRFRAIAGIESAIGPEWIAESRRGDGYVSVWHPMGEGKLAARGFMRTFGGHLFVITVRSNGNGRDQQV